MTPEIEYLRLQLRTALRIDTPDLLNCLSRAKVNVELEYLPAGVPEYAKGWRVILNGKVYASGSDYHSFALQDACEAFVKEQENPTKSNVGWMGNIAPVGCDPDVP